MTATTYETAGGIRVHRTVDEIPVANAIEPVVEALDAHRGVLLASSYEYPGRSTRWDMGFVDPPLALTARNRDFRLEALNARGRVLLAPIAAALRSLDAVERVSATEDALEGAVRAPAGRFVEEERSRQPSVFSLLRALGALFHHADEPHLGLYGAFGYDLAFQFEPIRLRLERPPDQRDLLLYLPDELVIVDHRRELATVRRYEFEVGGRSTAGLPRTGSAAPYVGTTRVPGRGDHAPGEYAAMVRVARESFARGDLFEVVPGQTFREACPLPPSELFRRLRERNPSPYGFLISLGEAEYLVGASPEMYARLIHTVDHVEGRLRPEFDALDAFLAHAWAVTVTGAPKAWAMQFIEDHERSSRAWYGGAVGVMGFDGNLNTGLTLRTIRVKHGIAEVRAGATLLYDSDPAAEEAETELKASVFLDTIRRGRTAEARPPVVARPSSGRRVLLVDHHDAFDDVKPHLVVLSPGPGTPRDFDVAGTIDALVRRRIPAFGVCLGLQGMVEYFGGALV